jgi:hypothetical protein
MPKGKKYTPRTKTRIVAAVPPEFRVLWTEVFNVCKGPNGPDRRSRRLADATIRGIIKADRQLCTVSN